MNLRIVSGTLRGRVIRCPDRDLAYRPTLGRTRQSIADMVTPDLRGASVADVCAGSGAFGFEMLSRGAAMVDFVESDRSRMALIREHAEEFGVLDQCRFVVRDAAKFAAACTKRYGVIFFDPPYEDASMQKLVPALLRCMAPWGVLMYQRRRRSGERAVDNIDSPAPHAIKTFGDTVVECYRLTGTPFGGPSTEGEKGV